MSAEKIYTGSCLCDGIHYEIHGEIGEVIECHCQRCRKANGTAFATNAPIQKADFKITKGEELLKKFASTATTTQSSQGSIRSLSTRLWTLIILR